MPAAYSKDLRERAIAHMKEGMRATEIANFLKISRRSVDRWWVTWIEEERSCAQTGYQKGHSPKIVDLEKFEAFIVNNPNKTQEELGKLWDDPCSYTTIGKGLKRIDYTYKKRL